MDISVTMEIPMGHRLPNHAGRCRHYHGHNYIVTAVFGGRVDTATGMIADFADLKTEMRAVLDRYDHTMVLQDGDPLEPVLESLAHRYIILDVPPTAENLAILWYGQLRVRRSDLVEVRVKETGPTEAIAQGLDAYVHEVASYGV